MFVLALLLLADPAYPVLERAYVAVRAGSWDSAIAGFRTVLEMRPERVDVRKDLGYAYLKAGENELARDQFGEAMRRAPEDVQVALEYAFLCYETRQTTEARRVFDRLRRTGNATAAAAFENVDRPLREGLARWRRAVELAPDNFTNHEELAKLAEQRDELALAAEHYERAWRLRPDLRSLLLALGRVWKLQGRDADAMSALLAASRGAETRTAERTRELLPSRYPYVYEFRRAIALDPKNLELRRELAYLLLEMGSRAEAEQEFEGVLGIDEADLWSGAQLGFLRLARGDRERALPLLDRVLKSDEFELADRVRSALKLPLALRRRPEVPRARVSVEARVLAEKSIQAGYLKDALKYLRVAHENDPLDFDVMLKLGWTHNMLREDGEAVRWFRMAGTSPDAKIAAEARQAYGNLRPALSRIRTSGWIAPVWSSRWGNAFGYGQVRTELRLTGLRVRPYLSVRFVGDTGLASPVSLSESSFIAGAGVTVPLTRGLTAWAEVGSAVRYTRNAESGRFLPDYRGGLAYARTFGRTILSEASGFFHELNADAVFISRFGNDVLGYVQNRTGYTLPDTAPVRLQFFWNANATLDVKRERWANFTEHGPGVRMRLRGTPDALSFTASGLRGRYSIADPQAAVGFRDLRVGLWYAFSR
jgi:tetratricopeptide (TPR) repeat protein